VWGAFAVAVAALLTYANSLGNGFVWDDPIILSRQLVVFRSAGDVLAPPRDIPQFSPDYYRPLTITSYLVDRAVGGERPFSFHLSVVLAHAAVAVLVYALALQLLAGGPAAWIGALAAGLLFAVHPIHTESVAWAAGRSDVLATGFLLAALLIHGRPGWSWGGSLLAGLCAAAALGAKETAVALYPLMLLRDLLVPDPARRRPADWLRGYAGPVAAGVVYVLLRRYALGEFVGSSPDALPAGQRSVGDLAGALGAYAAKLLWPVDLNAYIDHIDAGPLTVGLAIALFAGLGAAIWRWSGAVRTRRAEASREPAAVLFALAWLLLTLLPSLTIAWKIPDAPMAERYLYLPSVGFCLLAGVLLARLWAAARPGPARAALAVGCTAVLAAAALGSGRRNAVWHDDVALWQDTEPKSQVSGMAARNLGTAYQQLGRAEEARAAFQRALQRRNDARGLQTVYNNLGTLAMLDSDYPAAQRFYEAALQANPNAADTLFNLGLAVLHGGGMSRESAQAALGWYQRALRLNPHDPDIEAALAQAFDLLGQPETAVEHARRALELGARGQTADSLRARVKQAEAR